MNNTNNNNHQFDSVTLCSSDCYSKDEILANDGVRLSERDVKNILSLFIVESVIDLPFPASLLAAILFDFQGTIAEALANPFAMDVLSASQIGCLKKLRNVHWLPKVR